MNLYLDKYNGVWELSKDPKETHRWTLVARNLGHSESNVSLGSRQNDATMQEEFAPMQAIETGENFRFPPRYSPGEHVRIDVNKLLAKPIIITNVDFATTETVGTFVRHTDPGDNKWAVVEIMLTVDTDAIQRYNDKR